MTGETFGLSETRGNPSTGSAAHGHQYGSVHLGFSGAQIANSASTIVLDKEVINAFTAFSGTMKASTGSMPLHLNASRGASGARPEFKVVRSTDDEISAVAATIKHQQETGTAFRHQALLCASNARLSEIAEGLGKYSGASPWESFRTAGDQDLLAMLSRC